VFSENEAAAIGEALQAMTAPERLPILTDLRASLDDTGYMAAMAQIAPKSPMTADAGARLATDSVVATGGGGWFSDAPTMRTQDIAMKILAGNDILHPKDGPALIKMPTDTYMRPMWNGYVGTAYAGRPELEERAYQAYRSFYAAEAAASLPDDGQFDENIALKAARAVSGGVVDVGASTVVLPWGVDETTTLDRLRADWERQREGDDDLEGMGLQTVGDGLYQVFSGVSPVAGKDGKPVLLNARREVPAPTVVMPWAARPEPTTTTDDVPTPPEAFPETP
jgi:hypothetical protein